MSDDTKTGITGGEWQIAVDDTASATIFSGSRQIALVYPCYGYDWKADTAQHDANCKAIRAVPRLIEALKKIVEQDESCSCVATDTGYGPLECSYCIAKDALDAAGVEL